VVVEPDPTGDFKTLLTPPPKAGAAPPKGCPKPDMANWKKLEKKCKTYDALHLEFSTQVTARVTAAIHAAESKLKLTGPLQVKVRSTFHHNAAHDPLYHWTFSFSAPSCGTGPCVGHAYEAGAAKKARIFSADHRTIFDVSTSLLFIDIPF